MSTHQVYTKPTSKQGPYIPGSKRTLSDAQQRNRLRWKLRGAALYHNLPMDRQLLTEDELKLIDEINEKFNKLRKDWTENTKKLGFKVGLYTCSSCGKHSDKEYLLRTGADSRITNFCKKHFNEFN